MELFNLSNVLLDATAAIEPRTLAALMGNAAAHAFEAGARQPEIFGKIQTLLLIAIAFIESVCIYSLVIALILIFAVN